MTLIDRYMASRMAKPFCASVAVIVVLLSLENGARLMRQLDEVNEPVVVLLRFMGYLIPEYLSLGLVFALFVAVAFAFRSLALSGELDIFAAVGISPSRILRVPILAAIVCSALQFGVRGYAEPWGETQLDRLGQAVRAGEFGVSVSAGEFLRPSRGTTLHVSGIDRDANRLKGVMMQSRGLTVFAQSATVINAGASGILMILHKGQIVREDEAGVMRVASFGRMQLPFSKDAGIGHTQSVRQRNARLSLSQIVQTAFGHPELVIRRGARATLSSRVALTLFVPILPFIALALAVPPKRGTTAFGIGIGIVLIVAFLQISAAIEDGAFPASPYMFAVLLALFSSGGLALFHIHTAKGAGFVEQKLQRGFAPLSALAARIFSDRFVALHSAETERGRRLGLMTTIAHAGAIRPSRELPLWWQFLNFAFRNAR